MQPWRLVRWLTAPALLVVACTVADQYVYTARRYDADAGCLDLYKSIDLVNGDEVSTTCAPTCFRYGDDTFTSKMCPPLPDLAVALDAASPECLAANGLYDTQCGVPAEDAGADADGDDDDDDDDDGGTDVLDASDAAG